MPQVWNIGNTTVRNPKRIENALKVYVEEGFSGNAKGPEREAQLHAKLKERDVLEFDGEASAWNGRKWRAAFYQLGFISYEKYLINETIETPSQLFSLIELQHINSAFQLTPAGKKLIEAIAIPEIEEIYTRQFTCYEVPNLLESSFPEGRMKPFILFLQVLKLLQDSNNEGLNKFETGLFLQKFQNHTEELPNIVFQQILQFRQELQACTTATLKRELKNKYKIQLQSEIGISPNSVMDYSDTTFRYFSLSGLFSRKGQTIVIRQSKMTFVNTLLATEPRFLYSEGIVPYLNFYYKNSYPLPTDNIDFAFAEVQYLANSIRDQNNPLLAQAQNLSINSPIKDVQQIRFQLITYNNWEREEDFAIEQQSEEAILDILNYLKVLNNETTDSNLEIDDRPSYLEWVVWRSFLAISGIVVPVHSTRRFPVDQDFYPRNTAPGGGSDLLIEFETYVLIVEVTLTTSHRQMAAESEPVRRHTVNYKEQYPNKDVYCLFIAPTIDNNVAETFRIGVWYKQDLEEFVHIVPMTITDFILAFELLTIKRFKNSDFKTLLERCLIMRNVRAPQWKIEISKEIETWRNRILQ
ncbi:AlwI family type II restriction endonuclease [Chryseobacterium sp. MEBOG07]|uniref:AlwI family type II restriction endonuclease n=1 Tax=Chryseobacterium sp. MEBOG07 TaxID=2879939 RepID=UPI001F360929|nr:AlwI family type II restriction endonuclease [Chryseobacterium sp. MEBOG07]UKB81030.1 AlwI family type II restriction endonuclease [Chryseobacterium sp. MEBOG07]